MSSFTDQTQNHENHPAGIPAADLGPLLSAPQIHTDADGVHRDDAGAVYAATTAPTGELAYTPTRSLLDPRPELCCPDGWHGTLPPGQLEHYIREGVHPRLGHETCPDWCTDGETRWEGSHEESMHHSAAETVTDPYGGTITARCGRYSNIDHPDEDHEYWIRLIIDADGEHAEINLTPTQAAVLEHIIGDMRTDITLDVMAVDQDVAGTSPLPTPRPRGRHLAVDTTDPGRVTVTDGEPVFEFLGTPMQCAQVARLAEQAVSEAALSAA